MVKFGKQLERQHVQEWRSAYMDYKQLKRDIKAVKAEKLKALPVQDKWWNAPLTPFTPLVSGPFSGPAPPNRQMTRNLARQATRAMNKVQETVTGTFESFVSASSRAADALRSRPSSKRMRRDILKVKQTKPVGQYEVYTTELSDVFSSVEASAGVFFARLDAELNKVNHFYLKKEKEFIEHYGSLKKQVECLEEIRTSLKDGTQEQPKHEDGSNCGRNSGQPKPLADAIEVAQGRRAQRLSGVGYVSPRIAAREGSGQEFGAESIQKDSDDSVQARGPGTARRVQLEADSLEPMATVEMADLGSATRDGDDPSRGGDAGGGSEGGSTRPQMRLKIPLTTPGTTIRTLTQSLWEDLQKQGGLSKHPSSNGEEANFVVTKKNVHVAERMLRTAFIEFYRGLTMLKTYSSLNMVSFSKIVKKFDKASGYPTLPIYIKTVKSSYFNTSDKATILLEKVEALFAKSFARNDHSKARLQLRPPQKRASHIVTFFLGLFTGGTLAFLVVFATLLDRMLDTYIAPSHAELLVPSPSLQLPENIYLKTVFPLFCVAALIIIHMFMYGFNVFFWRKWRINYAFMFDLKPGTELGYREVFMAASVLMTILIAAMVGHLALHSISDSPDTDLVPLGVFMLLVVLLFCPLNVFYRSSRIFLITCFIHLALAPLYKVYLPDFFLGDQLTSQVPMLRNLQYLICYYSGSFFRTANADGCILNKTFRGFLYLTSLLPYWWRFLQCLRRVVEEHDGSQLQNAGKYLSAMVAVGLRIQYTRNGNVVWFVLFVLASIVATVYQTFWDLYMDWGLLRKNSRNKWLRDDLIMPKAKYWYFLCMIANVVLRLAWLQSITRFRFGQMDLQVADFSFAALEVLRRGIWNFFRMENEHLNNVGNYRATKTVPLPFEVPSEYD